MNLNVESSYSGAIRFNLIRNGLEINETQSEYLKSFLSKYKFPANLNVDIGAIFPIESGGLTP